MKVGLLVLIPSLENNWKQKGNFNFAIKISKKLLAFGINWLLICRFHHDASELGVSQYQSLCDSSFLTPIFSQSICLLVCLSVSLLFCLSVYEKHATLGFRPCFTNGWFLKFFLVLFVSMRLINTKNHKLVIFRWLYHYLSLINQVALNFLCKIWIRISNITWTILWFMEYNMKFFL